MKVFLLAFGILMTMLWMTKSSTTTITLKLNSKEDVCRFFPDNAVLRKPGSCKETIECKDGRSVPGPVTCTGDKIVKLDKMNCAADSTKSPDKYCTASCSKYSPKWLEDAKNCNEWHQCKDGKYVKGGTCPAGQNFVQAKQICTYDNIQCDRFYNICNLAKISQKFLDEYNCHKYFVCNSKGEMDVKECELGSYYDARSGQCIKKAQVNCYKHPTPQEACGSQKFAIRNRFINDQATCRGYFYCKDLGIKKTGTNSWNYMPDEKPDWGQCAMGYFFDETSGYCGDMNSVKCVEDRCDSRDNGMILSQEPGCQHYLVCKNGYTAEELRCPNNEYFDPISGECVNRKISYAICN